jgi:ferritin-like metal-binding protein YciE
MEHAMDSMHELFVTLLKDVHSAETQLVEALPRMAEEAGSDELKNAFEKHLEETREQVQRLERILKDVGEKADGEPCEAMQGLVEEAEEIIDEADDDDVRDAGLIASAQAVEHYEIARYAEGVGEGAGPHQGARSPGRDAGRGKARRQASERPGAPARQPDGDVRKQLTRRRGTAAG